MPGLIEAATFIAEGDTDFLRLLPAFASGLIEAWSITGFQVSDYANRSRFVPGHIESMVDNELRLHACRVFPGARPRQAVLKRVSKWETTCRRIASRGIRCRAALKRRSDDHVSIRVSAGCPGGAGAGAAFRRGMTMRVVGIIVENPAFAGGFIEAWR